VSEVEKGGDERVANARVVYPIVAVGVDGNKDKYASKPVMR
jgi:hypothetical protein